MKRATFAFALALLLLALSASATWAAGFGSGSFDMPIDVDATPPSMTAIVTVTPHPVVNADNPDDTGYPFINNWKGLLNRDVQVFLIDSERRDMTQARVDETVAVQPLFEKRAAEFMTVLMPGQQLIYRELVATADLEVIAAMTEDDWVQERAFLSQQLHLTADQEMYLKALSNLLIADVAPVRAAYASRFDTVIAAAEHRVATRGSISTEER